MKIEVGKTLGCQLDVGKICEIVNQFQYFFSLSPTNIDMNLPGELTEGGLLDAEQILAWGYNIRPEPFSFAMIVSETVNIPSSLKFVTKSNVALICDHLWRGGSGRREMQVVRRLLTFGLGHYVKHTGSVSTCIADPRAEFNCLCADCEDALRKKGYRDGVAALIQSVNRINQVGSSISFSLDSSETKPRLRLAEGYRKLLLESGVSFKNYTILVVLHLLGDLLPFIEELINLGAEPKRIYIVAKPYPYSRRDEIAQMLENRGANVFRSLIGFSVKDKAREVLEILSLKEGDISKILVIEDGGYFAPLLHDSNYEKLLNKCVGIVEQTQKGINEDKKIANIKVPILNVAESRFKKDYESPEIGRIAIQNITRFTPNIKLSGRRALVFGFGSVGQEVSANLTNALNMSVSVVDSDPSAILRARHRRNIVSEAYDSYGKVPIKDHVLIVGTTGKRSIEGNILGALANGAVVVSTSSDQVEIDVDWLKQHQQRMIVEGKSEYSIPCSEGGFKSITLLAEGYPINFYGSESLPNDTIDPIMTMLLLCAAELSIATFPSGVVDDLVNKIAEQRELVKRFLEIA